MKSSDKSEKRVKGSWTRPQAARVDAAPERRWTTTVTGRRPFSKTPARPTGCDCNCGGCY